MSATDGVTSRVNLPARFSTPTFDYARANRTWSADVCEALNIRVTDKRVIIPPTTGSERARVMFLYWGRRGALSPFTLEVGRAALADPTVAATISVSRQNENFEAYKEFGQALMPIDTFSDHMGALTQSWRVIALRRQLAARLAADRTEAVIELMPHVWSPLVAPVLRRASVRYITILHDADRHLGDATGMVKGFSDRALPMTDRVFTLSHSVADQLAASGRVPAERITTLFHPDLHFGPQSAHRALVPGEPMRLLFFGRILAYKGLSLFLDAVDILKREGHAVHVGVYGEGALGANAPRLSAMGAEVRNRWLNPQEISEVFAGYHAMVASHIEASQSGTVAASLGACLPVVVTPVGGLVEQIEDGVTGVIADDASAPSLAAAISRLMLDPQLYDAVCRGIAATSDARSMSRFVQACVREAMRTPESGAA